MLRRPSVVRPSSVVVVRRPSSSSSTLSNLNISEASCPVLIKFYVLNQNSGFHGNRKPPLTYNGENDVCTFFRLFLIRSFLYLQVTRTCIKSRTSSNFGGIRPLTTELAALEHLKNFP